MKVEPTRSFKKFTARLDEVGLHDQIERRARALHVSLRELYDGDKAPSIISARKAVYVWLVREGKSVNEIARLFDRAPSGVWKMTREEKK